MTAAAMSAAAATVLAAGCRAEPAPYLAASPARPATTIVPAGPSSAPVASAPPETVASPIASASPASRGDAWAMAPPTASFEAADAEGGATLVIEVPSAGAPPSVLRVGSGFMECGQTNTAVDPVEGAPRLYLVQLFCEHGEDEFSRFLLAVVVDIGASPAPRILWEGAGSFRSSFGRCDHIDVPEIRAIGPAKAEVVRFTEVISRPNPQRLGGGDCRAEAARRRREAELSY